MVDAWTDSTTARERVETIATTLSEPRTVNRVAEQADVEWDTAKRHLESLAESGILTLTDDGQYVPDPTRAYFDHLRDLILENERSELRAELEAIAERVDHWKQQYGVESPEELEATLAEDLPADEVSDRRRVLRRWEQSQRSRDLIRKALALYDDVRSLGDGASGSAQLPVEEAD
jgi:DNA-binding transcriptional ArsR family regulator